LENASSAFARGAGEGCRGEARQGEGGLLHGELRRDRSCVIANRTPIVPPARWKRMIGRHLPAGADSAFLSDSPVLAAVLAGPAAARGSSG